MSEQYTVVDRYGKIIGTLGATTREVFISREHKSLWLEFTREGGRVRARPRKKASCRIRLKAVTPPLIAPAFALQGELRGQRGQTFEFDYNHCRGLRFPSFESAAETLRNEGLRIIQAVAQ